MLNKQMIIAIPLAIGIGIVAVFVLWPDSGLAEEISEWIPGTDTKVQAEIDYTVSISGVGPFTTGVMEVEINRVLQKKKVSLMSIGPLLDIAPGKHEGWVVITSEKDGAIKDTVERDVTIELDWFQFDGSKNLTDAIWLGKMGTGDYEIRIRLYRELSGDITLVDEDSRTVTILGE